MFKGTFQVNLHFSLHSYAFEELWACSKLKLQERTIPFSEEQK